MNGDTIINNHIQIKLLFPSKKDMLIVRSWAIKLPMAKLAGKPNMR